MDVTLKGITFHNVQEGRPDRRPRFGSAALRAVAAISLRCYDPDDLQIAAGEGWTPLTFAQKEDALLEAMAILEDRIEAGYAQGFSDPGDHEKPATKVRLGMLEDAYFDVHERLGDLQYAHERPQDEIERTDQLVAEFMRHSW